MRTPSPRRPPSPCRSSTTAGSPYGSTPEAGSDRRPGSVAEPATAGVLRTPLPHPRDVADQPPHLFCRCLDHRADLDVAHPAVPFTCLSKKVKMRLHASSAAASSYWTSKGSVHDNLPVCGKRKPCLALGYSLTSLST